MCKAAMGDLGLHHFRAFIVFGSSVVILNANARFYNTGIGTAKQQ